MTTADTRTVETIVLGLAKRVRPRCSLCYRGLEHPVCNGTGQVAAFPMLHEDCIGVLIDAEQSQILEDHCCLNCGWLDGQFVHAGDCDSCQGRGWLPVATADALLEAVWAAGFVIIRWTPEQVQIQRPGFHQPVFYGDGGGEPNHSLARALEAALQQETPDADA